MQPQLGSPLATNVAGPRRLKEGGLRDLVIGTRVANVDGTVTRAGGKVVKNVTGYDVNKLHIGSYGTLGVITQAAFRLHPLPQASRLLVAEVTGSDAAGSVASAVIGSQVVPSAVEVFAPAAGPVSVAVLLEGTEHGVAQRSATVADLVGATAVDETPAWFGHYPFAAEQVGLKITTEIVGLATVLAAVRRAEDAHGGQHRREAHDLGGDLETYLFGREGVVAEPGRGLVDSGRAHQVRNRRGPLSHSVLGPLEQHSHAHRACRRGEDLDRTWNHLGADHRGCDTAGRITTCHLRDQKPARLRERMQPESRLGDNAERPVATGEQLAEVVAGDVLDHLAAGLTTTPSARTNVTPMSRSRTVP